MRVDVFHGVSGRVRAGEGCYRWWLSLPSILLVPVILAVASLAAMTGCGKTPDPIGPSPGDPPRISCPASPSLVSSTGQPAPVVFGTPTVVGGASPISTSCTPTSGSMFPIGTTSVTCTALDGRQRSSTCSFSVNVTAPARIRLTKFLAFGDSITLGEDGNTLAFGPPGTHGFVLVGRTYPDELQRLLAVRYPSQTLSVDNKGYGGEKAGSADTVTRFNGLLATGLYESALIMEGSNDVFDRDPRLIPPALANLRAMIRSARNRSVRPYLATIPPMDPSKRYGGGAPLVVPMNDELRALARSEGVDLVDVHQGFGGNLSLLSTDGLHPNAEGFAKIAETFFGVLRATLELPAASGALSTPHVSTTSP